MKNFPIKFSPSALQELDDIFQYLLNKAGLEIALKIDEEIQSFCFEKLAFFPEMGVRRDYIEEGIRFFSVNSYGLYYFFDGDVVTIVHVLHQSRDIKSNF